MEWTDPKRTLAVNNVWSILLFLPEIQRKEVHHPSTANSLMLVGFPVVIICFAYTWCSLIQASE